MTLYWPKVRKYDDEFKPFSSCMQRDIVVLCDRSIIWSLGTTEAVGASLRYMNNQSK